MSLEGHRAVVAIPMQRRELILEIDLAAADRHPRPLPSRRVRTCILDVHVREQSFAGFVTIRERRLAEKRRVARIPNATQVWRIDVLDQRPELLAGPDIARILVLEHQDDVIPGGKLRCLSQTLAHPREHFVRILNAPVAKDADLMAVKVTRDLEELIKHLVRIGFAVGAFRGSSLSLIFAGHAGKVPLKNRRANVTDLDVVLRQQFLGAIRVVRPEARPRRVVERAGRHDRPTPYIRAGSGRSQSDGGCP